MHTLAHFEQILYKSKTKLGQNLKQKAHMHILAHFEQKQMHKKLLPMPKVDSFNATSAQTLVSVKMVSKTFIHW